MRRGLEANGHTVTTLRYSRKRRPAKGEVRRAAEGADAIYLPSFTHADVRFTKRCLPGRRIVFDPLISRHLTKVHDYRQVHRWSPRAWKNRWKDQRALGAADLVLTDTEAHATYFQEAYQLPAAKFRTLYIGAETDLFTPPPPRTTTGPLRVGFYGAFAPLQGVPLIVHAAQLLRHRTDIEWEIIGSGFDYARCRQLANELNVTNIHWRDWLPFEALPAAIQSFDICLGIFGASLKTDLVIPNKLYHYAACGRAILTADTPAVRELFSPGINVALCDKSPTALAEQIERLSDIRVRKPLEAGALQLARRYDHRAVARQFCAHLGLPPTFT